MVDSADESDTETLEFEIYVPDAICHPRFTAYSIKAKSKYGVKWNILKRYKSIRKLHHKLQAHFPQRKLPPFPPKKWWGSRDPAFVERRRMALELYLQQLARDSAYYRHEDFLKFLRRNDKNTGQHQVILFGACDS